MTASSNAGRISTRIGPLFGYGVCLFRSFDFYGRAWVRERRNNGIFAFRSPGPHLVLGNGFDRRSSGDMTRIQKTIRVMSPELLLSTDY